MSKRFLLFIYIFMDYKDTIHGQKINSLLHEAVKASLYILLLNHIRWKISISYLILHRNTFGGPSLSLIKWKSKLNSGWMVVFTFSRSHIYEYMYTAQPTTHFLFFLRHFFVICFYFPMVFLCYPFIYYPTSTLHNIALFFINEYLNDIPMCLTTEPT